MYLMDELTTRWERHAESCDFIPTLLTYLLPYLYDLSCPNYKPLPLVLPPILKSDLGTIWSNILVWPRTLLRNFIIT